MSPSSGCKHADRRHRGSTLSAWLEREKRGRGKEKGRREGGGVEVGFCVVVGAG